MTGDKLAKWQSILDEAQQRAEDVTPWGLTELEYVALAYRCLDQAGSRYVAQVGQYLRDMAEEAYYDREAEEEARYADADKYWEEGNRK